MIDLHCHFLPAVDDGARTLAESLALASVAVAEGITHAVITPHFHQGIYDNSKAGLLPAFESYQQALREQQISLQIALAGEVRISTDLLTTIPAGQVPYLGQYRDKSVLLLELPYSHIPPGTDNLLKWLAKQNIVTLIAHPERNREVIANPHSLKQLQLTDVMFQLTVGSFAEEFGEAVRLTAERLLFDGLADVVASDAHRIDRRPPKVREGLSAITSLVGESHTEQLSVVTPRTIAAVHFQ